MTMTRPPRSYWYHQPEHDHPPESIHPHHAASISRLDVDGYADEDEQSVPVKLLATLTALVIAAATLLASLGAGPHLFGFVRHVPGRDVTAHALLFGALGLTVATCPRRSSRPFLATHWRGLIAVLALLVTAEEVSQAWLPHRSLSGSDLAASLLGLFSGAWASALLVRPRARRQAS